MDQGRPSMMARLRGSSSGGAGLPLAAGFFPRVGCSREQEAFLRRQADQLRADAVQRLSWAMSYEDGASGWKLSSSQKHFRETGIRTYCRRRDGKERVVEFRCFGKVAMPLRRALAAVYADNTADFRANSTFLMENCLDAAVLHVIERRSDHEPFRSLGIHWLASRTHGLFSKNRDLCYVRATGTMRDHSQAEIGYVVIQSIELNECGLLEASHGLARSKVAGILLFKENAAARTTTVTWQGTSSLAGLSSGRLVQFVHETFTSVVANLNKFQEAKYMAQQVEGFRLQRMAKSERKYCYICGKKFSLVRPRFLCGVCGENMCRDCEITSRAKAFNSEHFDVWTPTAGRTEVTQFCKKCVGAARRELDHSSNDPSAESMVSSSDDNLYLESSIDIDEADSKDSNERLSTLSSSDSSSSMRRFFPDRSILSGFAPHSAPVQSIDPSPLDLPRESELSSASNVPPSPVSMQRSRQRRRSRLETDPMEEYDRFDNSAYGVPVETEAYRSSLPAPDYRDRRSYQESRESDLATRLREISQRAQETLDATRRNSCMMSDTSSAPRVSDLAAFKDLDKSIAEQADLLNVIGFVSTGRVYMETGGPEQQGGVRMSESSEPDAEDRFEVLA